MASIGNLTLNTTPNGSNNLELGRQAEVIILKRISTFNIPGTPINQTTEFYTPDKLFAIKYAEFLSPQADKAFIQENKSFENRDDNLYKYYQIRSTSVAINQQIGATANAFPDNDVSSIQVVSTIKGASSAQIVLRNPLNKYLFQQNNMFIGQSIFESNDIVYVFLPGLDGRQYRVFTGLITTVSIGVQTGETLLSTVTLECDDMLKLLSQTRVNAVPSINPAESRAYPTPLITSFADKLPHQIMSTVLARAYCNFYSDPNYFDRITQIRLGLNPPIVNNDTASQLLSGTDISSPDPAQAALDEANLVSSYSDLPTAPQPADVHGAGAFLVPTNFSAPTKITQTVATNSGPANIFSTTAIPGRIYGFRSFHDRPLTPVEAAGSTQFADNALVGRVPDDIVFIIDSTAQFTWELGFGAFSIDRFVSEWTSGLDIANKIIESTNFELFTTPEGIVRMRPFNALLPADISHGETTSQLQKITFSDVSPSSYISPTSTLSSSILSVNPSFSIDYTVPSPQVGSEYWLQNQFVIAESYSDTDNEVFTIAYVFGDPTRFALVNQTSGLRYLNYGVAVDSLRLQNLGERVAPQKTLLNITDSTSAQAYAISWLANQNAKARTANVQYIGDARLRAGNPCYIPARNRIYYIESIVHSFSAGQSYTMDLKLTYGRVPVAMRDSLAAALPGSLSASLGANIVSSSAPQTGSLLNVGNTPNSAVSPFLGGSNVPTTPYSFTEVMKRYNYAEVLDKSIANVSTNASEYQRYLNYGPTENGGDGSLVFQGYVWEDIPVVTYEDIQKSFGVVINASYQMSYVETSRSPSSQAIADVRATTTQASASVPGGLSKDTQFSDLILSYNRSNIII